VSSSSKQIPRRPLLALAVFADGHRAPVMAWTVNAGETQHSALLRTALEQGAEYVEIIATLH
jgi:hypothetical protein